MNFTINESLYIKYFLLSLMSKFFCYTLITGVFRFFRFTIRKQLWQGSDVDLEDGLYIKYWQKIFQTVTSSISYIRVNHRLHSSFSSKIFSCLSSQTYRRKFTPVANFSSYPLEQNSFNFLDFSSTSTGQYGMSTLKQHVDLITYNSIRMKKGQDKYERYTFKINFVGALFKELV